MPDDISGMENIKSCHNCKHRKEDEFICIHFEKCRLIDIKLSKDKTISDVANDLWIKR